MATVEQLKTIFLKSNLFKTGSALQQFRENNVFGAVMSEMAHCISLLFRYMHLAASNPKPGYG